MNYYFDTRDKDFICEDEINPWSSADRYIRLEDWKIEKLIRWTQEDKQQKADKFFNYDSPSILKSELNKLNEENGKLKNENFNLLVVISNVKMELKMRGISINGFTE